MNEDLRRELLPEMIRDTLRRIEVWLRRLFWLAVVVWVVLPAGYWLTDTWLKGSAYQAQVRAYDACVLRDRTDPSCLQLTPKYP